MAAMYTLCAERDLISKVPIRPYFIRIRDFLFCLVPKIRYTFDFTGLFLYVSPKHPCLPSIMRLLPVLSNTKVPHNCISAIMWDFPMMIVSRLRFLSDNRELLLCFLLYFFAISGRILRFLIIM